MQRNDEFRKYNLDSLNNSSSREHRIPIILKTKSRNDNDLIAKLSRKKYFKSLNDVYSVEEKPKNFIRNQIDVGDIPGTK